MWAVYYAWEWWKKWYYAILELKTKHLINIRQSITHYTDFNECTLTHTRAHHIASSKPFQAAIQHSLKKRHCFHHHISFWRQFNNEQLSTFSLNYSVDVHLSTTSAVVYYLILTILFNYHLDMMNCVSAIGAHSNFTISMKYFSSTSRWYTNIKINLN